MNRSLMDILACPACHSLLALHETVGDARRVTDGVLACGRCGKTYPIRDGIPRFVAGASYAASFGVQWNRFRTTQLDSASGVGLSAERFYAETGWTPEWLRSRRVLDAGCGAGRFMEVAAAAGARVVGVDLSSAVDAAAATVGRFPHADVVQASLYELPFQPGAFDACYCIGVLQHTPDPERTLAALPLVVKTGGQVAVVAYERKRWTRLHVKYLVRPLTTRVPEAVLLRAIRWLMPLLFTVSEVLFRIPAIGRVFRFLIPVANYTSERRLTLWQRYELAILDTFDMLSPTYDQPQTAAEVETALTRAGVVDLHRRPTAGLTIVGTRSET